MSKSNLLKKSLLASILMLVSAGLSLGLFVSLNEEKERNDIEAYEAHYRCLGQDYYSIIECQHSIGNPVDYAYQLISYSGKMIFGSNGFNVFLLFFSFSVYFLILYISSSVVVWSHIPVIFLLTDFRFYELGANVLRNGVAAAFVALVLYLHLVIGSKKVLFLNVIPSFAHISALPALFLFRYKVRQPIYIFIFFICSVVGSDVLVFFLQWVDYFPSSVAQKSFFYFESSGQSSLMMPVHYAVILFFGWVMIGRFPSDRILLVSFNAAFAFSCFFLIFSSISIGYRFLNYIPIFLSIILARGFDLGSRGIKDRVFFVVILNFTAFLFFLLLATKNYEAIMRNF